MRLVLALLAAAVALVAAATAASTPTIRSMLGSWSGTLHQQGAPVGEVSFRVTRIGSSTPTGRVVYPGLGCSGRWTFLGLDRTGTVFRWREEITRGASGICRGVGIVWLRPLGARTLAYRWTDGHLVSAATVTREPASKP